MMILRRELVMCGKTALELHHLKASALAHGNVVLAVGFLKGNMRFPTCRPGQTIGNFQTIFDKRNYVGETYKHNNLG